MKLSPAEGGICPKWSINEGHYTTMTKTTIWASQWWQGGNIGGSSPRVQRSSPGRQEGDGDSAINMVERRECVAAVVPDEPAGISSHSQVQRRGGEGGTTPPWWSAVPTGVAIAFQLQPPHTMQTPPKPHTQATRRFREPAGA